MKFTHQKEISLEDLIDKHLVIINFVNAYFAQAIDQGEKIEFVACAIVYSIVATKRFNEILLKLRDCSV